MARAEAAAGEASRSAGTAFQDGDEGGGGGRVGGHADGDRGEEEDEDAFDDPRIAILDAALDHLEAHG